MQNHLFLYEGQKILKVAIIGQSNFAAKLYDVLQKDGHEITGVFTIPDKNYREDPLARVAASDGIPVFKINTWQSEGVALPEVLDQYRSIEIDLNVIVFYTESIPMEVINYPLCKSICFHPSLLPRHRGYDPISWTILKGDETAGFSVFWVDDSLHAGPVIIQHKCEIALNDTLETLYNRFIYPQGVEATTEVVNLIADGFAPTGEPQPKEGATCNPMLNDKELLRIDWKEKNAEQVHDFIRALDSMPGSWTLIDGKEVWFYGSSLWNGNETPVGKEVNVDGQLGVVSEEGLLIRAEGGWVRIEVCKINDKTINASNFGKAQGEVDTIEFSEDELQSIDTIKKIWREILNYEVDDGANFFDCGAGSIDVVRLVEELKDSLKIQLRNLDVYLAPKFSEFATKAILAKRTVDEKLSFMTYSV